jgi:serine-type D-Ala-D-Ala carboxypeptidase (penicillin-binding protein 5/6)
MRKVVTMFALCGTVGCLFVSPAHAGARADTAVADTTVGGTKLSGHGYIYDHKVSEPPHIVADSYVVADLETGQVLAAKDPHGHFRPASTLKTLTAITLIPRLDPHKKIKPSLNAVNASGSAVGLDTKMSYTVNDLFHGLLMQSGNDAAIALAEAGGGMKETLAAMNAEAKRIQALDTVARTPNGLDDDPPLTLKQQHMSAYDLALVMKQGLTLPDFRKYVGARLYHWPAPPTKEQRKKGKKTGGYEIGTHDHLLVGDSYSGMIGGKNGWTSHALGSFVGAAKRHGHTIIIALMRAQSDFWPDARALLNWGFEERGKAEPVGTLVDPIPPPPPPKPKIAERPASSVRPAPANGLDWWKIGLPAGAAVAIIAGLVLGLRRRRRPAPVTSASPVDAPPVDAYEAADPDATPPNPPGDVKVAGAPIGDDQPPPSWETAPNPVQGPAAEPSTTHDTGPWTLHVPDQTTGEPDDDPAAEPDDEDLPPAAARDPFEPVPDKPASEKPASEKPARENPALGEPVTPGNGDSANGGTTARDESHGDEAARS